MIIYAFYLFAVIQIYLSWKSLQGGFRYLRFFRKELAVPAKTSRLSASVIVPCRGKDKGMERNLEAVFRQDHPRFEIVFVVDSKDDPASRIVEQAIRRHPEFRTKLVVAGIAKDTGQKIHNLIEAVSEADAGSEVFAFLDSDVRPDSDWLQALIAGLPADGNGCSSGYRWFIPEDGGIASHFRSVWNASIASALGPDVRSNFCWGGSTAISRRLFEELDVARRWRGKLADDFALTHIVNSNEGTVSFVPSCLTASVEDCTVREMFEFTTRQMKITRVYRPDLWVVSLIGSALFLGTMLSALVLLFFNVGIHLLLIAVFLVLVIGMGTAKSMIRLKAVSLALPEYSRELRKQISWHCVLWLITPLLFLYNGISAMFSRKITWRGIEYELESRESTRIVDRDE
ncbi:MAG: glycosyltransferase [Acidobacteria bacterium]|nr:MAG: glycosyltransferase [Acidobacteriota bacterium]REK03928.1 MAG: glycosyltransferase [Acidobacteriota bacterium]REK15090.1 MAG: glycosyltransferase [Acidobacteriota bacterium]REK46180.1 MAG: glycosyltransferase [Acidobacteriota bacterium]